MIEAITDACIMHEKVVSDFEKSSMYMVKTFLVMRLEHMVVIIILPKLPGEKLKTWVSQCCINDAMI